MPIGFTSTFFETHDFWQQIDPCEGVRSLYLDLDPLVIVQLIYKPSY